MLFCSLLYLSLSYINFTPLSAISPYQCHSHSLHSLPHCLSQFHCPCHWISQLKLHHHHYYFDVHFTIIINTQPVAQNCVDVLHSTSTITNIKSTLSSSPFLDYDDREEEGYKQSQAPSEDENDDPGLLSSLMADQIVEHNKVETSRQFICQITNTFIS